MGSSPNATRNPRGYGCPPNRCRGWIQHFAKRNATSRRKQTMHTVHAATAKRPMSPNPCRGDPCGLPKRTPHTISTATDVPPNRCRGGYHPPASDTPHHPTATDVPPHHGRGGFYIRPQTNTTHHLHGFRVSANTPLDPSSTIPLFS